MENPLAPTSKDLEQAYGYHDPNFAGHQGAEAVVASADGITVLCSANPKGDAEHTWLIHLALDGSIRWERHYESGRGVGQALVQLPGSGFAIAGAIQRSPMAFQGYMLRVDANGNVIAGDAFGPGGVTGFNALVRLGDGAMLAAGTAGDKSWLMQTDPMLHTTWNEQLDDGDDLSGVVEMPDGGFATAGRRKLSTTRLDFTQLTVFAADRIIRWQKQLPTDGNGEPKALAALPDSGLIVVGTHAMSNRDKKKTWIVRLNSAGDVVWEKRIGDPDDDVRRGTAVAVVADGGFAIAGIAMHYGVQDLQQSFRLTRLAGDGTVLWERSYGGEKRDEATGIATTPDGGFVLVGSTMSRGPGKTNVWILKLDGQGAVVWDRVFGSAAQPPD